MSNDNVIDLCNDDDDDNTTEFEVRNTNTHFFVSTNTYLNCTRAPTASLEKNAFEIKVEFS